MSYEDYIRMILGEGMYASDAAQLEAERAASQADTRAAIASIFGDLGMVPEGYSDPFGATAAARGLASKNPFSTMAQIDRGHDQSVGSMKANRAGRGVINSGGTTLQAGDIAYNTGLNKYQAVRQAMSQVGDLSRQFAEGQRGRLGQFPDILSSAMDRLMEAGVYPQQKVGGQFFPTAQPSNRTARGVNMYAPTYSQQTANKIAQRYLSSQKPKKPGQAGYRPF